jgi:hypothetical protein
MANRTLYPSWSFGAGRVFMDFELLGNSTSAPTTSTDAAQCVASVSRSGVGVYVVTLKDSFKKVVFKAADVDDTLNDGAYATVSDVTNEGTSTPLVFTIRTRAATGTAADIAVGRRLGVTLVLRNGLGWGQT